MALALRVLEEVMPIRFRCAYCNQLMGIAHRKAGSVVRCPKCAGEIIVPVPEGMAPPTMPEVAPSPEMVTEQPIMPTVNPPQPDVAISADFPALPLPAPLTARRSGLQLSL